ncbi:MAG: hypothetical protein U9R79_03145, partial [Armatimonadota bacterium]|nr:hypothetical protein [Armatimonadota bacterium]
MSEAQGRHREVSFEGSVERQPRLDEQESDRRQCRSDERARDREVLNPSRAGAVDPAGVRRR